MMLQIPYDVVLMLLHYDIMTLLHYEVMMLRCHIDMM